MHSERFPRDNFPTLVAPMTSYTHRRAPARDHGLVSDASTFPLHRIHLPSGYLRPDDRTHGHDVHGRSPNPFTACRSSSASARSRRGPGTFGAKRSLTAGTGRHHCCPVVRPSYPIPEKHGDTGHVRIRQINVLNRHLRLSLNPSPTTVCQDSAMVRRSAPGFEYERFRSACGRLRHLDDRSPASEHVAVRINRPNVGFDVSGDGPSGQGHFLHTAYTHFPDLSGIDLLETVALGNQSLLPFCHKLRVTHRACGYTVPPLGVPIRSMHRHSVLSAFSYFVCKCACC